jgi:hypothetical protein
MPQTSGVPYFVVDFVFVKDQRNGCFFPRLRAISFPPPSFVEEHIIGLETRGSGTEINGDAKIAHTAEE